jgi:uncharacterized protein YycO
MIIRLRKLIFKILHPFLVWSGKVHIPWSIKKCTGITYYNLLAKNPKPGLICVSRIDGELTDWEIPGFWKHAFLYVGQVSYIPHSVIEAVGVGVKATDLISSITSKDYYLVLECTHPLADKIAEYACMYAVNEIGTQYDYYLSLKQNTYYCSKLVWFSYDYACKQLGIPSFFNPPNELGVPTLSPSDIPDMLLKTGYFRIFFDSRKN